MGMSNATIRVSFHLSPDLVFRLSEEILSCCFSWFCAEVDAAALSPDRDASDVDCGTDCEGPVDSSG